MSNGLQSLLGRSLTQSLGLGDILSKRESETQRLGELRELQGQAELERARGEGQASLVSEMHKQRRQTIREVDMPRDKMSLLLSLGGAAVGGIGLGMGLSGAKLGAQIGSSLSGSRAPGQMVVGGLGAVQELGAEAAEKEMAGLEKRKLIAETGKIEAEALKTTKEAMGFPSKASREEKRWTFKQETGLRDAFTPIKTRYKKRWTANEKIREGLARKTAAGDLASVFSFMKVLDPDSTVMQGEYANAARTAGVPDRAVALIEKIASGQILTDTQREDFRETAEAMFKSEASNYISEVMRFSEASGNMGLNKNNIFGKMFFETPEQVEKANLTKGSLVFIDGVRGWVE
jgi:hypothetical protein